MHINCTDNLAVYGVEASGIENGQGYAPYRAAGAGELRTLLNVIPDTMRRPLSVVNSTMYWPLLEWQHSQDSRSGTAPSVFVQRKLQVERTSVG